MQALSLDKMSRVDKVIALEALWQDLSREEDQVQSPAWHGEELAATQARVDSGEEQFLDWVLAKKELRKRFE
jgi:Putative addiction module component